MHLFITGTDTGIGKTYFTAWLVKQWRQLGHHAAGLKPIACGDREDAKALRAAVDNELTLDEINAVHFLSPTSPHVAALVEHRNVDWGGIAASIAAAKMRFTHVAVEGVGGWLVPVEGEKTVREWAIEMNLPVLVVARAGLGTINHILLTVESVRAAGLTVAGVVLNAGLDEKDSAYPLARNTNAETLATLIPEPILVFDRAVEKSNDLPAWLK
jgi:dethiobiotin synthetase